MPLFVFRNATLEPFFSLGETAFSGYGDISAVPADADEFLWFYLFSPEIDPVTASAVADDFLNALEQVCVRIPLNKRLLMMAVSAPMQMRIVAGDRRIADAVERYNAGLFEFSKRFANCQVVSTDPAIFSDIDWRFYFVAQIPFSPRRKLAFAPITEEEFRIPANPKIHVPAIRKKCLALDLDGTLWGGIVGEDGISGIKIGGDYPGNAFSFFQTLLVRLAESGIILAIVSKNNPTDVEEIFEKHPFLKLRREHISAWRVGWGDKATALREIATELNIGLDAFVFVDNEPRECELVRRMLPEVAVPNFPAQAYVLPAFFESLLDEYFRTELLTAEDLNKAAQYRGNAERMRLAAVSATFEDYLISLETKLEISEANDWTFPRLAQLSQKTNQFNLTTRRYTETDLRSMAAAGAMILSLGVKDRFGDSGIVGLAIVTAPEKGGNASIDTFLLSCRVLGRGVEAEFLREVLERVALMPGVTCVLGEYIPTPKNGQVEDFYLRNGFEKLPDTVSGRACFKKQLRC